MLKELVSPPVYDTIVGQSTENLLSLLAKVRPDDLSDATSSGNG